MKKTLAIFIAIIFVLGGCAQKTSAVVSVPEVVDSAVVEVPTNPSDDLNSSSSEAVGVSSSSEPEVVSSSSESSVPAVNISSAPEVSSEASSEAPVSSSAPVIAPTPVSTAFVPTRANYPIQSTEERYVTTQEQKDQIYKWYDNIAYGDYQTNYYYDIDKAGLSKYYSHAVIMQAVQAILDRGYNPAMYFGGGAGNALTVIVGAGSPDGITFSTSYLDAPINWWNVLKNSDLC